MPVRHAFLLAPSLSLRLPRPYRDYPTKSLRHNLFSDPHPLNLYPSIFYKNMVGEGRRRYIVTSLSLVSSSLSPLAATLMGPLANVANKRLTSKAKSFICNTYKKHGEARLLLLTRNVTMELSPTFSPLSPCVFPSCSPRRFSPQQILKVAHLIPEKVQLPPQPLDFCLGAAIHGVIQFAPHAIFPVLPVLAHHDDRRLDRRQQRQNQVQQDKGIRIPRRPSHAHVDRRIDAAQDKKTYNKGPRPAELHHGVRDAFGKRLLCFDHVVRVAHGADSHELLRRMKLPPQHRQHIHSRMRFALQQRRYVGPADFHALCIFNGRRAGLMRGLLQHRRETEERPVTGLVHNDFLLVL